MASSLTRPAGPKPSYPGAHIFSVLKNPLNFLQDIGNQYGKIAHFKLGLDHVYLINDPDYAQQVLVDQYRKFHKGSGLDRVRLILGNGLLTSEDDYHQRQRRMMQPAFHRQRISAYAASMGEYAERASGAWVDGSVIDMELEMNKVALAIAGKTLFSTEVEGKSNEVGNAMKEIRKYFKLAILPGASFLEKLPTPGNLKFWKAKKRLDDIVIGMIQERRKTNKDFGDFLSMLIMSLDSDGDNSGMTDRQVRDEAMTIFLAGHETITNVMSWFWYLLTQHPEAQRKLQQEVDEVLAGRLASYEDLPKLVYTRKLLSETMRLYPPGWVLGRLAVDDVQLGDYLIPKGSTLLVSEWVMHHNPRYFPDPEKFDPERWTPESIASRPKFSYIPFGAGPHICIGEPFAWMEGTILGATVAQKWNVRLEPGFPVEPQAMVTVRPRHGMRVLLEKRK